MLYRRRKRTGGRRHEVGQQRLLDNQHACIERNDLCEREAQLSKRNTLDERGPRGASAEAEPRPQNHHGVTANDEDTWGARPANELVRREEDRVLGVQRLREQKHKMRLSEKVKVT